MFFFVLHVEKVKIVIFGKWQHFACLQIKLSPEGIIKPLVTTLLYANCSF